MEVVYVILASLKPQCSTTVVVLQPFNVYQHVYTFWALYQFRSEFCVPERMKIMKKAISERDFETFAETTMKVIVFVLIVLIHFRLFFAVSRDGKRALITT